jgi:hypothetical protein
LINLDDAMETLGLSLMYNLSELDISGNTVHNWIYEKFTNNTKIEKLVMKEIHDYIS